ncbi:MAG: hypothetical protein HY562_03010, partial [Ignavibacteriales bacterium]|nr:hypothetical protein [Ignavibacteriales bacterium]
MSCKTCRNMSGALMLTSGLFLVASAQVKIKERVNIIPRVIAPATMTTPTQAPLIKWVANSFGSGSHVVTTRPGVVINGSLTVTPATIPNKTALEIFLNAFKIYQQINGCGGSAGGPVNPLPLTFPTCGSVSLGGNSWSPFFASCLQQRTGSQGHTTVSGNSATIRVDGDFNLVPTGVHWTATFELTASLDPAYEATDVLVTSAASELINGGSTTISVEARNGLGQLLTVCTGNDPILATASLQANGSYAYLQAGSQSGTTVTFPLSAGKGAFTLVLDQSNGIIPECLDHAGITVTVDNASGSTEVDLKCTYPKPTVSITEPQNNTTYIISAQDQPVIEIKEDHTPKPGEEFEPEIGWAPAPRIDTKDYFDLFEEDTTITVTVEARNAVSTARDTIKIILIKQEQFCTQVNFGSSSIRAGDTTSLTFKKILNDGTEDEFEAGQFFNVSATGGGQILKDSTLASSLTGVALPISFIAPESIEGDSVEIQVIAEPTNGGSGGSTAFKIGPL